MYWNYLHLLRFLSLLPFPVDDAAGMYDISRTKPSFSVRTYFTVAGALLLARSTTPPFEPKLELELEPEPEPEPECKSRSDSGMAARCLSLRLCSRACSVCPNTAEEAVIPSAKAYIFDVLRLPSDIVVVAAAVVAASFEEEWGLCFAVGGGPAAMLLPTRGLFRLLVCLSCRCLYLSLIRREVFNMSPSSFSSSSCCRCFRLLLRATPPPPPFLLVSSSTSLRSESIARMGSKSSSSWS
mmetsp:Transcript_30741/g.52003  ORF Transcript_30741/g.52003 Transcript_30741/m.52003 type:complete len:240 (+) Transcript_30741:66-785(+)